MASPAEGIQKDLVPAQTLPRSDEFTKIVPSQQLEFLYKSLEDAQSVIRFLDTKAAFGVVLISAMLGKLLMNAGAYFPLATQPLWRSVLVIGFGMMAGIGVILVGLVVFPSNNPAKNVSLLPSLAPPFFLSKLAPRSRLRILCRSPRFSRLDVEQATYIEQIAAADTMKLLQAVSAEVLKVSYIRQIKMDRLKVLGPVLALCAVLFTSLLIADAGLPKPGTADLHEPTVTTEPARGVPSLQQLPEQRGTLADTPARVSNPRNRKARSTGATKTR